MSPRNEWNGDDVDARSALVQSLLIAALLCAATIAIYHPVRDHAFVNYDDYIYIVDNPNLREPLDAGAVVRAFSQPYETNWIPLTWLSLHLDYRLFGSEPAGYLLENAALHALSAVLLYLAFAGMSGDRGCSAFAAAVFAVHPLHVESVAWAAERKDTLSGVFFAATLLAYGRYAAGPSLGRYLAVVAAGVAGLLAKPMLVTLPLVLLLLDFWPLRRWRSTGTARLLAEKLPLLAAAVAVGVVTVVVQRDAGAMSHDDLLPFPLRVGNALEAVFAYVRDSFWPSGLAVFYPHSLTEPPLWTSAARAGLLAAISFAVHRAAATRPYLLMGWLWFGITLLPVLGLVQVGMQSRADRYMYLPQIGLAIAVAWSARSLFAGRARGVLAVAAVASLLALTVVARLQVAHWRDTRALFERAAAVTEGNFLAHQSLGDEFLEIGEPERALPHLERSVAIKPRWGAAQVSLADALQALGRTDEALVGYRRALQIAPGNALGHANYGRALAANGDLAGAIERYEAALTLYGDDPPAEVHAYLASARAARHENAEAEASYRRAIALRPGYAAAHANLGFLLLGEERFAEAREQLTRARELDDDDPEVAYGLGVAAAALGDARAAVAHYRAALLARPGWPAAANNLAWLLATHPDPGLRQPSEAVRIALALRGDADAADPAILDTLAAAYAAAGRFAEAAETAETGARLAGAAGRGDLAGAIAARAALYRAQQPFIDREVPPPG